MAGFVENGKRMELNGLIEDIRSGDDSSFARLAEEYRPLIESQCQYFGESACMSADDYRQEALIALYGAVLTFRFDAGVSFGYYARVCIRNRLITVAKKIGGDTAASDECIEYSADSDVDPESLALEEESFNALNSVIDENLTSFEKTVFNLYILGKTYTQTAAALGRSEKSIANALCRIRAKIRKLI